MFLGYCNVGDHICMDCDELVQLDKICCTDVHKSFNFIDLQIRLMHVKIIFHSSVLELWFRSSLRNVEK